MVRSYARQKCRQEAIRKMLRRLITYFGIPHTIMSDIGSTFIGAKLSQFSIEYEIYWLFSSSYYPQGNVLAESTNKNLTQIIKRNIKGNPIQWHTKLDFALWAYRINVKLAIKISPYALVYGKRPVMLIHMELYALKIILEF